MSEDNKICIAIIGGGIGGVALAATLSELNASLSIQIDLYESAQKITQVGAGITLWPRGWELLKELGVEDDLAALLSPGQEIPTKDKTRLAAVLKKSDQVKDETICEVLLLGGSASFHRADVLGVLLKRISPSVNIHLGHRLKTFSESENGVDLVFTNGNTAKCDMLVGADGINSLIRKKFLAKEYGLSEAQAAREGSPLWTGTIAYRSVIDSECVRQRNPNHPALSIPISYCGKNKHVISYPISAGTKINAVAFFTTPEKENTILEGPSVLPQTTDNVSAIYEHWSDEVRCITDNMINPSRWAIERVKPLDKYGAGRIVLLGDSAHAMSPHLGSGAGQAFEDAHILAHLLNASCVSNRGLIDIPNIISVYSAVRQPFGNFVAQASIDQGKAYELASEDVADVQEGAFVEPERLAELGKRITGIMEQTCSTSLKGDLERALKILIA